LKDSAPLDYSIRIKAVRQRLGLTQLGLAQKIGVSFASINRWENGQARPNRLAWQKILEAEQHQGIEMKPGGIQNQSPTTRYETILPPPLARIGLRFLFTEHTHAEKPALTGQTIYELLARRLIRRVLISPPAGALESWECDLFALFGLSFHTLTIMDMDAGNPFIGPASDLIIVEVNTLNDERTLARLQEAQVEPYDLIIIDEEGQ